MLRFIFSGLLFFIITYTNAQIPSGYYNTATGSGYTLKTQLHDIIDGHSSQSYSSIWTFVESNDLDAYYENNSTILDIYSENPSGADPYNFTAGNTRCGNQSIEGDCYNREHSFPASWFSDASPMFTDIHHLYPTDGRVNNFRGNLPFGEVATPDFTSLNGSKRGSSDISGYSGTVFEPIDEFKGDIARTYFYMATRYEDVLSSWSRPMLDGSVDQVFEDWALDMLLDWHTNDPVSQKEIDRNDNAYSFQGNRNPFVDHPEYVNNIWGTCTTPVTAPTSLLFSDVSESSFTIDFTAGDGDLRLVLVKESSAVDFDPVNGTGYGTGANTDFSSAATAGTANKVISVSGTTSITVTGLSAETTYHVEVFEYCSAGNLYLTASSLTGSTTTSAEPTPPGPSSFQYLSFNEIVMSTPGADYEIIELAGIPGLSLTNLSILTIDQSGQILIEFDLTGESIPADGFWLGANSEAGVSVSEDYVLSTGMINNTTTFLLVDNFSGSVGDDVDTNNDGTLDSEPWDEIIDELGIIESVGENVFSATTFGPDGSFLPAGAYRNSDGCGAWTLHTFDSPPVDVTPGVSNGSSCYTIFGMGAWTAGVPDGTIEAIVADDFNGSATAEVMTILSEGSVTLQNGDFLNVLGDLTNEGSVTVESGASMVNGGAISGDGSFTIMRNTTFDETTGKYSFVSSPVEEGQVSDLGTIVYEYDESELYHPSGNAGEDRYVIPSMTEMEVGKGYASAYTGTISFTGIPNSGNLSVGLTKTNHSAVDVAEADYEGFNLVGNPYPSAISLNDFFTANSTIIEENIWLWDDDNTPGAKGDNSDFITVNSLGAVSGGSRNSDWNGFIGSMQGFFVQVKEESIAGSYDLSFSNAMRSTSNNADGNFFRNNTGGKKIKLSIAGSSASFYDELLIGYVAEATTEKDSRFDAVKLITNNNGFYSFSAESKLAIQGLPLDHSSPVKLGAILPKDEQSFTITIKEISNPDQFVFLIDKKTGTVWDLKSGAYHFKTTESIVNDRFSILTTDTVNNLSEFNSAIEWIISADQISAKGLSDNQVMLQVYDLSGKLIDKGIMKQNGDLHVFDSKLTESTIYILRINDGESNHYKKIVIR